MNWSYKNSQECTCDSLFLSFKRPTFCCHTLFFILILPFFLPTILKLILLLSFSLKTPQNNIHSLMAEVTKKPEVAAAVAAAQVDVVPEAEKPLTSSDKQVSATPEAEKPVVVVEAEKAVAEAEADATDSEKKISQQVSFREETNVVGELPESQRKALDELKKLIVDACAKREFSAPPPPPPAAKEEEKKDEEKKVEEVVADNKEVEEKLSAAPAPAAAEETAAAEKVSPPPPAASVAEAPKTAAETAPVKTEEVKKGIFEKTVDAIKEKVSPPPPAAASVAEAPKTAEAAPVKTEEVKKGVLEKTVEAIKETIVEVVATTSSAEETPQKAEETVPVPVPEEPIEPEEVSIWGIPLLADERSDVILLKFLRARDFKVKEAFTMIRNTVRWRKEFGVDEILTEDLGNDYDKVLFTHGVDKEGRVVCYNVFGEFQDKELYQATFSDAEKRNKFFKSLIQFIEKIIRDLDFSPKGVNSIVLVNDLKNSPGYGKRDVSKIIDKFLVVLQDNYPEFVAKQLCINTSWWYVAYYWIYLTVFTPRSKSKFVFASPSKTPETLFKYIAPEHVPIQYGGHSKTGENEFTTADALIEVTIKPNSSHPIEFEFSEDKELVWELRVIGWDVTYGAEFLPAKEGGYTLNISKPKKVAPTDEPVIADTFKVTEAGKVVITIDNQSSKKKKLLYRSKVKVLI